MPSIKMGFEKMSVIWPRIAQPKTQVNAVWKCGETKENDEETWRREGLSAVRRRAISAECFE